jgi:hypothetical protein
LTAFVLGGLVGGAAPGAIALLRGVAVGSAAWFAVDVISGLGLVVFGEALGVRTLRDV